MEHVLNYFYPVYCFEDTLKFRHSLLNCNYFPLKAKQDSVHMKLVPQGLVHIFPVITLYHKLAGMRLII